LGGSRRPQPHAPGQKRGETIPLGRSRWRTALGGARRCRCARRDKLLGATLDAVVLERPSSSEEAPQHLCLDKGYDNQPTRELVEEYDYDVAHIRRIGEGKLDESKTKRYPARRWVVERTLLGWLSKCRAILVRYEKKAANYLGLIKVACILLW
jgi:putative transposase